MTDTHFLNDDLLLSGETARSLFHQVAEDLPIVDVHGHLPPKDLATDRVFETITEIWLEDDHYKWRAMRQAGVDEQLITGDADPWDKFTAWAATVPRLIRNPLYLWTHLELRRVFGIDVALDPSTAEEIWDEANRLLPMRSAHQLLALFDVRVVATTDDPADGLRFHRQFRDSPGDTRTAMVPTFRPDAAHRLLGEPDAWNEWADRLSATTGVPVTDLASLRAALTVSVRRFAGLGGRASDHGLSRLPDRTRDPALADDTLRRVRDGTAAHPSGRDAVLLEVVAHAAQSAVADDSVMQLHLGALRDGSPRLLERLGSDVGGDSIGDEPQAGGLARLLGDLEADGVLPRTVLFNVNPAQNAIFASIAGTFTRSGLASLVQWGPAWWFNDHERGIRRALDDLSDIGQLAGSIGMVTDSRSLLSMTRHEVFRRIVCDVIGHDVDEGRIPADQDLVAQVVSDLCGGNAIRFFGFTDPTAEPSPNRPPGLSPTPPAPSSDVR